MLKRIGTMTTSWKIFNARIIIAGIIPIFIVVLTLFINRETDWWVHPDVGEEISMITIYHGSGWVFNTDSPLARITNDYEIKNITKILGRSELVNRFLIPSAPYYILELVEKNGRRSVIGVNKKLIQFIQGGCYRVNEELYELLSVYGNKSEDQISTEDNQ